jgi:hypothetical protein
MSELLVSEINIVPIPREAGLAVQRKIVGQYLKLIEDLTKGDATNGQQP